VTAATSDQDDRLDCMTIRPMPFKSELTISNTDECLRVCVCVCLCALSPIGLNGRNDVLYSYWLSKDVVRFKIELGLRRNVQKCNTVSDERR